MGGTLQIVLAALGIAGTVAQVLEPLAAKGIAALIAALEKKQAEGSKTLTSGELHDLAAQAGCDLGVVHRMLQHANMRIEEKMT